MAYPYQFRKSGGNKYHNKKVEYNGIKFDSKKEKDYYLKIKDDKTISNLQLQVRIELLPKFVDNQGNSVRKMEYVADFVYEKDNITYIVDTKGFKTSDYKLKKKLLLYKIKDDKNTIFVEL